MTKKKPEMARVNQKIAKINWSLQEEDSLYQLEIGELYEWMNQYGKITKENMQLVKKSLYNPYFCLDDKNYQGENIFQFLVRNLLEKNWQIDLVEMQIKEVLASIVAMDDFSIFLDDGNLECVKQLYLSYRQDLDIEAIFHYFSTKEKLTSMVNCAIKNGQISALASKISDFYQFLEKQDIKVYIYKWLDKTKKTCYNDEKR